jgi:UDP-N-acetylmuramate--alanine ligase
MSEVTNISNTESQTIAKEVYFLGIAGIGMSALARYFLSKGAKVSGYDKTVTAFSKQLEAEGIDIHYTDDVNLANRNADLIIYTPAIPKDHIELQYFLNAKSNLKKRSEVLGMITKDKFNISVAGTHGKTTTSAMVAHLLQHSGVGCTAFLGGIATNYNSNFIASENPVYVVEADEFDRSFLQLCADVAIITSMDADHLDIYGTAEKMQDAFVEFAQQIKPTGKLIAKFGLERLKEVKHIDVLWYDLQNRLSDIYCKEIRIVEGAYEFDIQYRDELIENVQLNMGGSHNIENVLAAVAVAKEMKISHEKICAAIKDFKGVRRRFEKIYADEQVVLIDDYAHHPEELRTLIAGVKELYAYRKCIVVFQPHLFSRTKDHAVGFAEVLSIADETLLLPIYPARELPMEGVTSEIVAEKMSNVREVIGANYVLKHLSTAVSNATEPLVIVIAGAGDIDTLVQPLKKILEQRN